MAIDILAAMQSEPQPIDFVLPGLVVGTVGAVVSPGGVGKSFLAMQLAGQIAGAPDLLGVGQWPTGRAVYLPTEDPEPVIVHRVHAWGKFLNSSQREAIAENLVIEPLLGHAPNLRDQRWVDTLTQAATGSRLVILDTLRRFHTADENDGGEMVQLLAVLEGITAKTGCSILYLHHTSKAALFSGQGDQQQASRGSSVLTCNIRWQAFLAAMTLKEAEICGVDEKARRYWVRFGVAKQNAGQPIEDIWLRRMEGGVLKSERLTVYKPLMGKVKSYDEAAY